ncbi:NAD dependent epimerase/dehydratase family protein [Annulohypoxylon bovei var. microspora]|nr:NAD dependent epimerase/dehydratase family protein [Annulohypoxylon bovei var. microspora]
MASSSSPNILLTGATGYIGGTILSHLLNSPFTALRAATITCLLRGPDRATRLISAYGSRVNPIVYKDLDDTEATVAAAAQHDIVINTTDGWHAASSQALLRGLAQRKASTGRDVWFIQTSGTSNIGDRPITKTWVEQEGREFDDAKDDIYGYEKEREQKEREQKGCPYPQRTTELAVVDTGLELGVKTLVIMSPTIFGFGTGLWNKLSVQIPLLASAALQNKRAVVVGDGKGTWDHVHIEDLAELYVLVVGRILEKGGKDVPTGKKGIIFSGNGRHLWLEVTQGLADVIHEKGLIADRQVQSIGISDTIKIMGSKIPTEDMVELGFVSNSRTVSNVARGLGWKPTRGEEAWRREFRDVVEYMLAKGA